MPKGPSAPDDGLYTTRWIHVFEEDTAAGAVYRPAGTKIPLSRRPRERIEFAPDGSAKLFMPGPDDRLVQQAATWHKDGESLVLRHVAAGTVRIVDHSPTRLLVR